MSNVVQIMILYIKFCIKIIIKSFFFCILTSKYNITNENISNINDTTVNNTVQNNRKLDTKND